MRLETERLILRKPKKSDWKDVVEALNDLEVSKQLIFEPYPYTKMEAIKSIKSKIKDWDKKNKVNYVFFMELKSEKKVIGLTGIYNVDKHNSKCTTGSWINRKYWRKGYLLESKIPILDFIFNKLKLRKVETGAHRENKASIKMSKKLGFKVEGIIRKSFKSEADGRIHDNVAFGLLKEEWKKVRPKIKKKLDEKIKKLGEKK